MPSNIHSLSPFDGHRIWAASYDTDPNPLLSLEFRILSQKTDSWRGKILLDAGCGTGRWLSRASLAAARVVGADFCPEMLAVARQKLGQRVPLVLADLSSLPVRPGTSDVTLCSFCAGYVADRDALMRELARVTRSNGTVYVSDFHPAAHARGWQRSFRIGARVIEIQNHRYTLDGMTRAAVGAGLILEELAEPGFGDPERAIFRQAGREDQFESLKTLPAIYIGQFRRV